MKNADNLDDQLKRTASGVTAATITCPTYGEVFPDGSIVELIVGYQGGNPRVSLWDGQKETVGPLIKYCGATYEPAQFPGSVLRELKLPTQCRSHETTRQLLAEICKLIEDFTGLPPTSASLIGRFALCSWLMETVQVAPALVLVGPDILRANQLLSLLHCLCRRGLPLTGLTPAGLRALPGGAGFTFLIRQPMISEKLESLLDAASYRDQKIPHRGGLLDLFGAQVIHVESIPSGESFSHRSIVIPMVPGGPQLPVLDPEFQHRVTEDFQAKLLNFRRANLRVARNLQFDSSKFVFSMRTLAHAMAAATPDDAGLQADVIDLLREKNDEIRSDRWTALNSVAIEAVLVVSHESSGGVSYIAELAEIAQEILRRRGEAKAEISPAVLGKTLKVLGFETAPRDAKGKKLRLTDAIRNRAELLARDFGGLAVGDDPPASPSLGATLD